MNKPKCNENDEPVIDGNDEATITIEVPDDVTEIVFDGNGP